jgi:hypothetical protein
MESGSSLWHSQEHASSPYPEPYQSSLCLTPHSPSHFLKIPGPVIIFQRLILAQGKQRTCSDIPIRNSYSNSHIRAGCSPSLIHLKTEVGLASKMLWAVWPQKMDGFQILVMSMTNVCVQTNLKCCRFLPAPEQTVTIKSCKSWQWGSGAWEA